MNELMAVAAVLALLGGVLAMVCDSTNVFVEAQAAPALETLTLDADPRAEGPGFVLTPTA